jgi:putative tryptophan/tyrosine transport system substrate-binding protein
LRPDTNCLDVTEGGLAFSGNDIFEQYRRTGYIDRILKREKPADLSVQSPTEYELVVNTKTAQALGLTLLPLPLSRAEEVIA